MSNYNQSYNNNNNNESASKLLELVLEDMNNIMKAGNDISNYRHSVNEYGEFLIENNTTEITPDKKFELMVAELQNCLKETADTRTIMQNLSSDKREFMKTLFKTEIESNVSHAHKVDLMDEISKLKLDISYLQRDKQNMINQITDLNLRIDFLEEENKRLKQENKLIKVEEIDYCIPPNESMDNYSVDESFQSKDSPISGHFRNDSPMITSTPDKSKPKTPIVPPHGKASKSENEEMNTITLEFLQKISPHSQIKESSGKSSSWSELRTNQVVHGDSFPMMTPPSQRKSSVNSQIRNQSFGKDDSKINSNNIKKKMKFVANKRISQPVSSNVDAITLLAMEETMAASQTRNGSFHFSRNNPLRMTAGPRLFSGSTNKLKQTEDAVQRVLSRSNPNLQTITLLPSQSDFKLWSKDHVCAFLHQIGLGSYANNCRKWLESGQQIIEASRKEIEKELGISNKMHLKKLLIHIRNLTAIHVPAATSFSLSRPKLKIAANFNTRLWLDDIGLLHYMSLFSHNCVDGYVLDQLSIEDLQYLKITNELHILSLKRGIQLLRELDYDLSQLIRRPSENTFNNQSETDSASNLEVTNSVPPGEVCCWTQHQVMEWLRRIELPEYASNIRGSGIHGALLILEDRFNANSLASVLNIPQNKSLLRRHLQAKFQELLGSQIILKKKAAVENPDYVPLTITSKMKYPRKKSFFSVIKRRPSNDSSEELLVPYSLRIEDIDIKPNPDSSSRIGLDDDSEQKLVLDKSD